MAWPKHPLRDAVLILMQNGKSSKEIKAIHPELSIKTIQEWRYKYKMPLDVPVRKADIIRLAEQGYSRKELAEKTGAHYGTVLRVVKDCKLNIQKMSAKKREIL